MAKTSDSKCVASRFRGTVPLILWLGASLTCQVGATEPAEADWPMWRYDANRSAASPVGLPDQLHLQWRRTSPRPRPAFPEDLRLCFDVSYEPAVMGKRLFVPSMVTDSVRAFDTDTGAEIWTFFADGPVRFAPVAWQGKVYFVSDDGYLYCVATEDGALLWKASGVPDKQAKYKVLGNERLVSRWPARGGPVVADGVVYFAGGIWPFEGVYVCAVNAETGQVLWLNRACSSVKDGLIDHGTRRDCGLSPQGYLAVLGAKVVAPSGRALPGFFDAKSGEMEPYTTGWGGRIALAKGCWWVCGIGDYLFQSGDVYGLSSDTTPVKAVGPSEALLSIEEFARHADVPLEQVHKWIEDDLLETTEQDGERLVSVAGRPTTTHISWWTGTPLGNEGHVLQNYPRLQLDLSNTGELGVFREPVLTEDTIYYSQPVRNQRGRGGYWPPKLGYAGIVACDITKTQRRITPLGAWGNPNRLVLWKTLKFDRPWSLSSDLKVHIKAGSRLYAGGPGVVAAVDVPDPRVSWQAEIEGTPSSMLAGDGKLFVVTKEGSIYCFGAEAVQPKTYAMNVPLTDRSPREWTKEARGILEQTGATEGYCLALGVGTGQLIEALVRQSALQIVAVEADARKVEALRRKLDGMGMYGSRVHILPGDVLSLELPLYMAGLVVSEDIEGVGFERGRTFIERIFASLRPYGGTARLPVAEEQHAALAQWVEQARLDGANVTRAGKFSVLTRTGALAGSADWSHESGSAANTFASKDQSVKPPFAVLWFGGSVDRVFPPWDYTHARGPLAMVASDRMFILVANKVHAIDAYTGRHLWEVALAPSAKTEDRKKGHMVTQRETADNFVAAHDCLYVIGHDTCLRLDPATGAELGTIAMPAALTEARAARWEEVRVWDDCLVVAAAEHLVCMDRYSGEVRWTFACEKDRFSFAIGDGKVFCVDHWLPLHERRGETKTDESVLCALDVRNGEVLWQTGAAIPEDAADEATRKRSPPLKPHLAYCDEHDLVVLTATRGTVAAFNGSDGTVLWVEDIPCRNPPSNWSGPEPPIVLADVLITHAGAVYDLLTGSPRPKRLWTGMNTNYDMGGARGCGRAVGSPHLATLRDGHAAYFDVATGAKTFLQGVRSGCTNSLIPAGGILNAPNFAHGCTCNWPIFTSYALVHMPEASAWD